MSVLKVENIRKNFGRTEVLKGIDFAMDKGDVVSVIGSSGSGKSTLLRCINLLETPTSGDIIFNGKSILGNKNIIVENSNEEENEL